MTKQGLPRTDGTLWDAWGLPMGGQRVSGDADPRGDRCRVLLSPTAISEGKGLRVPRTRKEGKGKGIKGKRDGKREKEGKKKREKGKAGSWRMLKDGKPKAGGEWGDDKRRT